MPYIQTIGEEYPDASLEDMITLIRITFDELGRLYRDGMMTEEEFLIQTNGFCISSELLNRQGIKLVKQPILSDIPQKMQDAFRRWKTGQTLSEEEWMDRTFARKGCTALEAAVWYFRLMDALKVPYLGYDNTPFLEYHVEEFPVVITFLGDEDRMCLLAECTNTLQLLHDPNPIGKDYELHFEGGIKARVQIREKTKIGFKVFGTIDDYVEYPKMMELRDEFGCGAYYLAFLTGKGSERERTLHEWEDHNIPHSKWNAYNAAQRAQCIRYSAEYRLLRLPWLMGCNEEEQRRVNLQPVKEPVIKYRRKKLALDSEGAGRVIPFPEKKD